MLDHSGPSPIRKSGKKVYCGMCEFFIKCKGVECESPHNTFWKDTYSELQEYQKEASELNTDNDCKWYKEGSPVVREVPLKPPPRVPRNV